MLFCIICIGWFVFDRETKMVMDMYFPGTVIVPNVLGIFDFQLVHNTGAAWGIWSNGTVPLGIVSIVVCVIFFVWLFVFRKDEITWLDVVSVALICAGGLGNAFDRLAVGYVVDFISCTFISFPVFNVADIGVTLGIVLFFISLFRDIHSSEK